MLKDEVPAATNDDDMPPRENIAIAIQPPNFQEARIRIVGLTPYVANKFTKRARESMMQAQMEGQRARKGKKREPKDFEARWKEPAHTATEGWYGLPASSLRSCMIQACTTVGFHMTQARKCLFVLGEGIDAETGEPLVKLSGKPRRIDRHVRLQRSSSDILPSPIWEQWSAEFIVRWDADHFSASDVVNLLMRAGQQVGIGAGRPASKNSDGMGWGTFRVET